MSTTHHITTAEQLLETAGLGRCELIRGELVMMSPAGFEHGRVAGRVYLLVATYVGQRSLGIATAAETGFQIDRNPDTVRAPDVGFIRAERVPQGFTPGFFQGAPDLAGEVLSPGDRPGEVAGKVQDWLSAGCRAVWVIDPAKRTVAVHDDRRQTVTLTVSDELTGGDVLPGFRVGVGEIFAS